MNFFRSKILTFFLLIIMLVVLIFVYRFYLSKKQLASKFEYLGNKINILNEENIDLEKQATDLANPEKVEQTVRKLYVLTKPGENAIIIPQELLVIPPELDLPSAKKGVWKSISDFFNSIF